MLCDGQRQPRPKSGVRRMICVESWSVQLNQEKLRLWISRPISIPDLTFGFFFLSLGALAVRERFLLGLSRIAATAAIPAPCARVERMRPAAQAGGPQAAERRAVLPARPSGPAPVLGDAGRARGVQSRRKTVLRPQAAWSSWRAAEKWQARGMRPCRRAVEPARSLFCTRSRSAKNLFHPLRNH